MTEEPAVPAVLRGAGALQKKWTAVTRIFIMAELEPESKTGLSILASKCVSVDNVRDALRRTPRSPDNRRPPSVKANTQDMCAGKYVKGDLNG